jgi:hypothetical protein
MGGELNVGVSDLKRLRDDGVGKIGDGSNRGGGGTGLTILLARNSKLLPEFYIYGGF